MLVIEWATHLGDELIRTDESVDVSRNDPKRNGMEKGCSRFCVSHLFPRN